MKLKSTSKPLARTQHLFDLIATTMKHT